MDSHLPSPTPQTSADHAVLPNQPFASWLRTQTTLFVSQIAAILGMIYFLVSLFYYASGANAHNEGFFTPKNIQVVGDFAHIVFIALFIGVLIRYLDDNSKGAYRVKKVFERVFGPLASNEGDESKSADHDTKGVGEKHLEQSKDSLRAFKRRFLLFWIMMLALYVSFTCHHTLSRGNPQSASAKEKPCVLICDPSRGPSEASLINAKVDGAIDYRTGYISYQELATKMLFPGLEFIFNNLSLLFVFRCFLVLAFPLDRNLIDDRLARKTKRELGNRDTEMARVLGLLGTCIVFGLIVVYLLVAASKIWGLTSSEMNAFSAIFEALSGILNSVALALLIARLDSRLIGLPSYLISVLYSYAAIQPLFVAFNQDSHAILEKITASVLVFVLVSKIYFFLIIMYAMQTGRMLNYLFCFPTLRDRCRVALEQKELAEEPARSRRSLNSSMLFLERMAALVFKALGPQRRMAIREFRRKLDKKMRNPSVEWFSIVMGSIAIGLLIIPLLGFTTLLGWVRRFSFEGSVLTSTAALDVIQLAVVLAMLGVLFLLRRDNGWGVLRAKASKGIVFHNPSDDVKCGSTRAKTQVHKIKEYFMWFWGVTLAFYVVLTIKHLLAIRHLGKPDPQWHEPLSRILPTLGVLACPALGFILGTVNLLFIFWCFVVVQSPAYDDRSMRRQKLLANYSAFIVLLFIALFLILLSFAASSKPQPAELITYVTVFDGISGTLSGVAMALLIARVDSKLFGLRPASIWILFTYASIQPLFVVFDINARAVYESNASVFDFLTSCSLLAALLLKICFFLIMLHVLQSGKMMHYLLLFPILKARLESIFENQFEIRTAAVNHEPDEFTFMIWKKRKLVYSTTDRFLSRSMCDARVVELQNLMLDFKQPQPDAIAGTYWAEIRDANTNLICESVPLRSQRERKALIEESIAFIPYCKYTRS